MNDKMGLHVKARSLSRWFSLSREVHFSKWDHAIQFVSWLVGWSVSWSVGWSVSRSIDRSAMQSLLKDVAYQELSFRVLAPEEEKFQLLSRHSNWFFLLKFI